MRYVGFCTPEYEREAQKWAWSAKAQGLDYVLVHVPSTGNWCLNAQLKAKVIRDQPRPLVYTDVDARFNAPPALFDTLTCDFAAHWRAGQELLSGTLFFGNTPAADELIDLWVAENEKFPRKWDQKNLQKVIESNRGRWDVVDLPSEYCKIFDSMKGPAIIEHFQASRRMRGRIHARHKQSSHRR